MSDRVPGMFAVRCANCRQMLMEVHLLGSTELATCEAHLRRACWAHDPLPEDYRLADVLRRLTVSVVRADH